MATNRWAQHKREVCGRLRNKRRKSASRRVAVFGSRWFSTDINLLLLSFTRQQGLDSFNHNHACVACRGEVAKGLKSPKQQQRTSQLGRSGCRVSHQHGDAQQLWVTHHAERAGVRGPLRLCGVPPCPRAEPRRLSSALCLAAAQQASRHTPSPTGRGLVSFP